MTGTVTFESVDALLTAARAGLTRLAPAEAAAAVAGPDAVLLVDIRPAWQRRREGEIPGSLIVERNHLEWRLHPSSPARVAQARAGQQWIVVCSEGYTSSLAAAALNSLGIPATDLDGGLHAWRSAGLPVSFGLTPVEQIVGAPKAAPASARASVRASARSSARSSARGSRRGSANLGDLGGPDVEHEASH
ncbi:rhodanese-like domain-containing protein [Jatrophihabitans telluris]|uniref:Rhodanese-like domain-containing protein n=1 Tax=Jatrophihabitans telluris TaxID=2038343 RepID=A0ABY4QY31_9ACTN|nr:rhodanese-like domain-containing protein [Jatrophihabitans telluris]UQX88047.1 rhodanese-like domain-containing protein [Jatrophihabitans telluris]